MDSSCMIRVYFETAECGETREVGGLGWGWDMQPHAVPSVGDFFGIGLETIGEVVHREFAFTLDGEIKLVTCIFEPDGMDGMAVALAVCDSIDFDEDRRGYAELETSEAYRAAVAYYAESKSKTETKED